MGVNRLATSPAPRDITGGSCVAGPIAYHDPLPRSKIVGIFKQRSRRRAR